MFVLPVDADRLGSHMHKNDRANPAEGAITESETLRARLSELEQQIDRQHRLATVGTIAGLIAHEFNNILTPMLSYAQMALAAPDDAELTKRALLRASESAERASRIANAILGFVRENSETQSGGGMTEATRPAGSTWNQEGQANLRESVELALACLGRDPARDGIRVTIDVDPCVEVAISPIALEHALLNMILNARNAMLQRRAGERPGGSLAIRACTSGSQNEWRTKHYQNTGGADWICIEIEDTGPGMSQAQLRRLLGIEQVAADDRPATRARGDGHGVVGGLRHDSRPDVPANSVLATTSNGATAECRGSGLGMVVCRRLVERAGGRVEGMSTPGTGTCIRLVLPASRAGVTGRAGDGERPPEPRD